jgi:hypothetical protein
MQPAQEQRQLHGHADRLVARTKLDGANSLPDDVAPARHDRQLESRLDAGQVAQEVRM